VCVCVCVCACVLGIWLLSTLFSLPPVFGWSRYEYIRNKAICTIQWSTSYSYAVAVIGLGVIVPFLVMIAAYTRIFSKARLVHPDSRVLAMGHFSDTQSSPTQPNLWK